MIIVNKVLSVNGTITIPFIALNRSGDLGFIMLYMYSSYSRYLTNNSLVRTNPGMNGTFKLTES